MLGTSFCSQGDGIYILASPIMAQGCFLLWVPHSPWWRSDWGITPLLIDQFRNPLRNYSGAGFSIHIWIAFFFISVFVAVGTCVALQLGNEPNWFFFESFSGMFLFYAAHWQSYVSGTLKFGRFVSIYHGSCSSFDFSQDNNLSDRSH